MNWKAEYKPFLWILGFFLFIYFMPIDTLGFRDAVYSALELSKWYAREHVLLCLIPAFFIAGVIAVFVSQNAVIKYFGTEAKKWISYSVASVSGTVLAVCSCTILPLFSGIYKRGAGLGPAITFLYSGPAINILAIILTARILGMELGIARVVGAVVFSVIIGLIMHFIYQKEELAREKTHLVLPDAEVTRPLWQTALHFFVLVFILIFATWGKPETEYSTWSLIYHHKWLITALFGIMFAGSLILIIKLNKWLVFGSILPVASGYLFFPDNPQLVFMIAVIMLTIILSLSAGDAREWMAETWGFAKQILPLLAAGVLAAGFLLGSQHGGHGIIPNEWIAGLVGGNSISANFFASIAGALMYFATLTEVPILQGLMTAGMGKGPALALLLAGPAVSLPNMLVIRGIIGTQKTLVYVLLVVIMATLTGWVFGILF